MSDHRSESDHPEAPPQGSEGDRLVESLLKRLEPNPLDGTFIERLEHLRRGCAQPRVAPAEALPEATGPAEHPRPARLALLTLASLGTLAAYLAVHFDLSDLLPQAGNNNSAAAVATVGERSPVELDSAPSFVEATNPSNDSIRVSDPSFDNSGMLDRSAAPSPAGFLPVSRQGLLVESSHEGVVETEEGMRERLRLEFRDAYHWHDPESGTHLRIYAPRSETVVVPLRTD